MSARLVPNIQPPISDAALKEWLNRLIININGAFSTQVDFTPIGYMPTKYRNGSAFYFSTAIAPDITSPGPWMYVEGTWQKLTI
jgi:hypothetical protein